MRRRTFWTFAIAVAFASSAAAQRKIPVGPFDSVELQDGGHVVVRHGPIQSVTLVRGEARIAVEGRRLLIENDHREHRRGERLEVEVVTPRLTAFAVSNGGTLRTAGAFPAQSSVAAAVEQGGTVDIRSLPAGAVAAAVDSGGRIFTHARETLTAAVRSGGAITYWGTPRVTRSVRNGGVVVKGSAADADKPVSDLGPGVRPVPPVPPVPPLR